MGAGPAGATTALYLAKAGIPCTLIDKAYFPRDKVCGDALSGKVVSVIKSLEAAWLDELALAPSHLPSRGVTFVSPSQEKLEVPFRADEGNYEKIPGYTAKRWDFDHFLIAKVRKQSPITFLEGLHLTHTEKIKEGYLLQDAAGETQIQTRLLIVANGAYSPQTKQLGGVFKENRHYAAGIRAYFENVGGMHSQNYVELHFLKEITPGYLWIFPLPHDQANVGLGMRSHYISREKINLKKKFEEILTQNPQLKERFAAASLLADFKGFGLPLASKKRKLSGDHFLLTGDAAYLIDPFTGEGIGNAMLSGRYAAEQAINSLKKQDFSARALSQYDQQVYKKLGQELRISNLAFQMFHYPKLINFLVAKANRNRALSEMISCMMDDINIRARLKSPRFYFQLLFG